MKSTILFFFAAISLQVAMAQTNDQYTQVMGETIGQLYQAQSAAEYDAVANKLTRIADAEKGKWEPHYYKALALTFKGAGLKETDKKDQCLDLAMEAVALAEKQSANNAEIVALQGFITMLKISVDPASRGQSLSGKAMSLFGKAMALDPMNPRASLFMAQMQIGTAQFFGTPIDEPCKLVQKSVGLFEQYQPTSPLSPMWGQHMIGDYAKLCNPSSGQ